MGTTGCAVRSSVLASPPCSGHVEVEAYARCETELHVCESLARLGRQAEPSSSSWSTCAAESGSGLEVLAGSVGEGRVCRSGGGRGQSVLRSDDSVGAGCCRFVFESESELLVSVGYCAGSPGASGFEVAARGQAKAPEDPGQAAVPGSGVGGGRGGLRAVWLTD